MQAREVLNLALGMVDDNQAELARRLQRSETTVSRWMTGRNGIDFESALRLARMTGLPASEVVAACGLDPALVPVHPEAAQRSADPEWARFVAEIEAGWRAMDEAARHMAARGARALFHVEPTNRRRRVTDQPNEFGRPNGDDNQPTLPRRKYQSQSVASQKLAWGFQPM